MDAAEDFDEWHEWQRNRMLVLRELQFAKRNFEAYASLRRRESRGGYFESIPYMGQDYDPAEYEMIDRGWDHEHCWVCDENIEVGDVYWASIGSDGYAVCPACYEQYIVV